MRMYDLIETKKRGGALTEEEIAYMVRGFVDGRIPDYQMSAMLMAIYFQGMNDREITYLTLEMAHSGDMVDLSPIEGIKVDKHSTCLLYTSFCAAILPAYKPICISTAIYSNCGW